MDLFVGGACESFMYRSQLVLLGLLVLVCAATAAPVEKCDAQGRVIIKEQILDGEISQIEWLSKQETNEVEAIFVRTSKHTIYRSVDEGKSFQNQSAKINGKVDVIYPTVNHKELFFLGKKGDFWVTRDQGDTYRKKNAGVELVLLKPHPTEPGWLLGEAITAKCSNFTAPGPCRYDLYVTTDYGDSWTRLKSYVGHMQMDWGNAGKDNVPKENIYVITWPTVNGNPDQRNLNPYDLVFQRTTDLFNRIAHTELHVVAFLFHQDTVLVAKLSENNPRSDLQLWTSQDDGETFKRAVFPKAEDITENRYTILDLSENTAFINVDHSDDGTWGTTYSSVNGLETEFSVSLKYNRRAPSGRVDFNRIRGLEGIYLANKLLVDPDDPFNDDTHGQTVITFDKGGEWRPLKAPAKDSAGNPSCDGCTLNLLGRTQTNNNAFYSSGSAIGIILATGSVGPWLLHRPDEVNTYLSNDAGMTWTEIAKGEHAYDLGDHGAITVIASTTHATDRIKYSWNQGLEWVECAITDNAFEVDNVITEPANTAEDFLVYGSRFSGSNRVGVVVHVDFENAGKPQCTEDDYEYWSPSDENDDKCLLGQRFTYKRRKQEVECVNPEEFEKVTTVEQCSCKREDFECDYCFEPTDDDPPVCLLVECDRDPFTAPTPCEGRWNKTQGYRLVPGDKCTRAGSTDYAKYGPKEVSCKGGDGDGDGGDGDGGDGGDGDGGGMSGGAIFGVVVLVLFVLTGGVAIAGFFLYKKNPTFRDAVDAYLPASWLQTGLGRRRTDRPASGAYSQLSQGAGGGGSLLDDLDDGEEDFLRGEDMDEPEELDDKKISSFTNQGSSAKKDEADDDFDPRKDEGSA